MNGLQAGQTIGRYRIVRPLGQGAMGEVYLAEDPTIERLLAIKTVRVEGRENVIADLKLRLLREAKAAGKLVHPHVVTLFDAGEAGDTLYLAFEFINGSDLSARLEKGPPFTLAEALKVIRQAAEGLDYAHQHGIVHRDIKPSNLMIDDRGRVKISDFGIAKLSGQATELTMTGSVVGSPHYLSPEQIRGEELDGRSDLFSLGVVLYELLSQKKPFDGDTLTSLIYKILHTEPPPLEAGAGEVAVRFNALLQKLMAKDKAERFASAGELATALADLERTLSASQLAVPAATVFGMRAIDAAAARTAVATPPLPPPPPGAPRAAAPAGSTAPTVLSSPPAGQAAAAKRSKLPLILGVAAVLVIALGVGGIFAAKSLLGGLFKKKVDITEPRPSDLIADAPADEPSTSQPSTSQPSTTQPSATRIASTQVPSTPTTRTSPSTTSTYPQANVVEPRASLPTTTRPPVTQQPSTQQPSTVPATPTYIPPPSEPGPRATPTVTEEPADEPRASHRGGPVDREVQSGLLLKFATTPPDAYVLVGAPDERGSMIGKADELTKSGGYRLPGPGEWIIKLRSEGRRDRRIRVVASEGAPAATLSDRLEFVEARSAATADLRLYRAEKGVLFDVEPKTARVIVDGQDRGKAGDFSGLGRFLKLDPGRHRVELDAPGYKRVAFAVEIEASAEDEKARIRVQIPKEGG